MWVFGYGSLVWRPAIPFERSVVADLPGHVRRFWQGSTDHRGVPGAPGRVVTLVPEADATCRGRAFKVPEAEVEKVLARLDHREKGGYDRMKAALTSADGEAMEALVYWATPDNPNWLGPAAIDELADQIVRSQGPSGRNTEYVLELDRALREMRAHDAHVRDLADAVRRRLSS